MQHYVFATNPRDEKIHEKIKAVFYHGKDGKKRVEKTEKEKKKLNKIRQVWWLEKMLELKFEKESYLIRGAIFEVYKEMGNGFLEAVYQECLSRELVKQEIPFACQVELEIKYKGQNLKQKYKPDFICYDKIILEIKSAQSLIGEHRAQLHNYLKATGLELGLLVNFGSFPKVEIERIIL